MNHWGKKGKEFILLYNLYHRIIIKLLSILWSLNNISHSLISWLTSLAIWSLDLHLSQFDLLTYISCSLKSWLTSLAVWSLDLHLLQFEVWIFSVVWRVEVLVETGSVSAVVNWPVQMFHLPRDLPQSSVWCSQPRTEDKISDAALFHSAPTQH